MSMNIADWSLLLSLVGLMFIFIVKLYRLMSVVDISGKKKKEKKVPYDFRYFVIEIIGVLFLWVIVYASVSSLLTLFSSWMLKIATFLMASSAFFFIAEIVFFAHEMVS